MANVPLAGTKIGPIFIEDFTNPINPATKKIYLSVDMDVHIITENLVQLAGPVYQYRPVPVYRSFEEVFVVNGYRSDSVNNFNSVYTSITNNKYGMTNTIHYMRLTWTDSIGFSCCFANSGDKIKIRFLSG